MRKLWFVLVPLVVTLFAAGATYLYIKPRLQAWLQTQIVKYANQELPIKVEISKIDWQLLLPTLEVQGLVIAPKSGDTADLPEIKISKARAGLDFLFLLGGQLHISSLIIEDIESKAEIDPWLESEGETKPLPLEKIFSILQKLPLTKIGIKKMNLRFHSKRFQSQALLNSASILLINGVDRLSFQLGLGDARIIHKENIEIPLRLDAEGLLLPNTLELKSLRLTTMETVVSAKASLPDFKNAPIKLQGQLDFEIFSDLGKMSESLKQVMKFPTLAGKVRTQGRWDLDAKQNPSSGFKLFGQKIKIDQFDIGDVDLTGRFEHNIIRVPEFNLTNESGQIKIKNSEFKFTHQNQWAIEIKSDLSTNALDMNEFLIHLGVGDIPVEGFLSADLRCEGPLLPQLSIRCEGKAKGEQLEIRSGEKFDDTILLLDEMSADGEIRIDPDKVAYKANVQVFNDKGTSDGEIYYKKGFEINFATPELDFAHVRRMAGLKVEGKAAISGSTQGDSHAAVFELNLAGRDMAFENYILGQASGDMDYEKGILSFRNVNGQIDKSIYKADIAVNLPEKRIRATAEFPRVEVVDALKALSRKVTLPVEVTGAGTAQVDLEGPLQFNKLSYTFSTQIKRGTAAGEGFDQVDFAVVSKDGEVEIKKATLTKNKSLVQMMGVGHPSGNIDIKISSPWMNLEESENVSKLSSNISGQLQFEMLLKGYIFTPDTTFSGTLRNLVVEEQEIPGLDFNLNLSRTLIEGQANLVGNKLKVDFQWPLENNYPFKLKLNADNWNYTSLFTLIGGARLLGDYQAGVTGSIELAAPTGGILRSTGHGQIKNLFLRRGILHLTNQGPMDMTMKDGVTNLTNFRLSGEDSYFEAKGQNFSHEDLNLKLTGRINLRLLQIFLPFLEELGGTGQASVNVSGSLFKPEILGSASLQNTFVKIKDFPHAFEKTQAQVQFSQHRVLIDNLSGSLAGGNFTGSGTILIEGPRQLPLNISATLENATFTVPDKIRTSGNADVVLSGSWFPFTLSGTYHVSSGYATKEFDDQNNPNSLKQSSYLPKVILENTFEPLLLNLNVILDKPLPVKNSIIEGSVSGQLLVKGPPTRAVLFGQLSLDKQSKLLARDKVFEVTTATAEFKDPSEINPDIYVTARTRVANYDINLLAQGKGKNPQIRLSSVPPLEERDIASLLALGITTQKLDQQGVGTNINTEKTKELGAAIIANSPLSKNLQQNLGVDLQISSQYDDIKNIATQRVTLSRKINDKLKASASRLNGEQTSTEVQLRYSINQNVSAIGTFESREAAETKTTTDTRTQKESQNIFGIDLDFQKEFK